MRNAIYIIFFLILGGLLYQVYTINNGRRELVNESAIVGEELELVVGENEDLHGKIEYFSNPRNLEKELRARFNYRLPYEKLIIVIPEEE